MKQLIVIAVAVLMSGCADPIQIGEKIEHKIAPYDNIRIIEIDGCEYIIGSQYSDGSGSRAITHKGNCKNHQVDSLSKH